MPAPSSRSIGRRIVRNIVVSLLSALVAMTVQYIVRRIEEHGTGIGSSSSAVVGGRHKQIALSCIQNVGKDTGALEKIGGLRHIKQKVRDTVLVALRHPKVFFDSEAPELCLCQRILLHGPPGTGKTMLARAIAKEAGVPFVSVTLSQLEDKYFGETPKIMRAVFSMARSKAPCVLFFDEIDGMMRTRRDDDQGCVYGMKTEFLQLCDGLMPSDAVVLIACTNNVAALDPAMKRRIPSIYSMPLPDLEDRVDILRRITRDEPVPVDELTVRLVAACTEGMSGSGLQDALTTARSARLRRLLPTITITDETTARDVRRHMSALTLEDWSEAFYKKKPSVEKSDDGSDEDAETMPPSLEETPPDGSVPLQLRDGKPDADADASRNEERGQHATEHVGA